MNHQHPIRRAHRVLGLTATALAVSLTAACSNDAPKADGPPVDLDGVQLVAALRPFDACDDFLAYVKQEALKQVGPYGLGGSAGPVALADDMASAREAAPTSAVGGFDEVSKAAEGDTANSAGSASGTNNQEAGVDEADLVKTDGKRIVTVRGNEVIVATLTDGSPFITGRVQLGDNVYGDRLFLLSDRAYVLGNDGTGATIIEVSLGDTPKVAGRTSIEGMILDGRMTGTTLRLVLSTPGGAGLGFVYPSGNGTNTEDLATETNRKVIESSKLEDWLPQATNGDATSPLLDCDHLYRPAELAGFSMLSILTIDDGLGSLTGSGVLADGQITYASTDHLYVATNAWPTFAPAPADDSKSTTTGTADDATEHTDIHRFSIAGTDPAAYEASGRVDGHVLNQYSMSESGDHLRIATTVNPQWGRPIPIDCPPNAKCAAIESVSSEPVESGDSQVVVLGRDGERLKELGHVDGLGTGEQIKSVRFVGDTAYLVTFRQTDPFYVLDLSDPAAPKKLGELKVPGFSSYLHPVGDHLVLGVGSEATEQGMITGAKLSLYDTSDPVNPKELANWSAKDLAFMAGDDPHAFTWDAEQSTAYLPYYETCFDICNNFGGGGGVLVVKVADGALTELGRIDHRDRTPSPAPVPPTTVPETTVPGTIVPSTTPETTVPETTVPATTVPETTETTVTAAGATESSTKPMPIDPGIGCDPAACDPMPVDPGFMPDYQPTITRVLLLGDRVVTLSDVGIAAHDRATLRPTGFAAF